MILIKEKLNVPFVGRHNDVFLFTANSIVKSNGELVMGAGIAKSVRDSYKGIAKKFGSEIKKYRGIPYGIVWVDNIGAFQTKIHYQDKSDLGVVELATAELLRLALANPTLTFHLNYPAINHGRLTIEEIQPIIDVLPDNVLIYKI